MNKISNLVVLSIFLSSILFFSSCDDGDGPLEIPVNSGVLIVNEGNFGGGNGGISYYNEDSMAVVNNVVENANSGEAIGASIQSLTIHDGVGYIVCNSSDKVEFISIEDYKYLANPVTKLSQPRYMAIVGDKGYITCWGPWDYTNYTLPNSYVAVMDLKSRTIVDTLACGSGPEGIIAVDKKLYVANSFETSVSVIDLNDNSSKKINLNSLPKKFAMDGSGKLWVSASSGLIGIDTSNSEEIDNIELTNTDGKMAIDGDGENIYLLTAQAYPSTQTEVYKFDTKTKTMASSPLISGENFYGIGYNTTTDQIYVGDSKAFAGAGKIYIYNEAGVKLDEQDVTVGPNGFAFK